ncbi:MAG: hypothetical protein LKI88_06550 [Bifidobacterium sp.]|jgi:hypothetical protein|nr:hypothetical protein [Bifidobacterium sp.]MCI1865575.1 hypothetical protein [Bifidobacterium sp.]
MTHACAHEAAPAKDDDGAEGLNRRYPQLTMLDSLSDAQRVELFQTILSDLQDDLANSQDAPDAA